MFFAMVKPVHPNHRMIPFPKTVLLFTAAMVLLLRTPAVHAGLGGIQDNGGFFSEQARAEASRLIGEVERSLKKDIVVETFKEAPESAKNGANLADKAAANRFFEQWAQKQAGEQRVNGIYILLVKQPAHLQVVVGNQTLKQAFTAGDREALVSTMLTRLRVRQNDAALLEGVQFAASTMRTHAGAVGNAGAVGRAAPVQRTEGRPAAQGSSWGWLVPLLIGLGVLWVVVGLVRSRFGAGAGSAGMPQGAGGGGFLSSMLGGMFGAAAGMWMYDQFLGSHGNAAPDRTDTTSGGDSGFSGQDTDYSGSGGNFSDDSGSGSGGGDAGGGSDSGGGDF